jgi:hypothetical protein
MTDEVDDVEDQSDSGAGVRALWKEGNMTIELLHVSGCPHVVAARALLLECLDVLNLNAIVEEKEGAYPSPTILVNGVDVMGAPASQAAACRLDVPTKVRLVAALRNL